MATTAIALATRVPRTRLLQLAQLQSKIFNTSFNPTSLRTGNKYLRARLRGPAMMEYYPEPAMSMGDIMRKFPELGLVHQKEATRLEDVEAKKARGKGAPKKAKTKADSRRAAKKRK